MEKKEIAELFMKGIDCSQVVVGAFAEELGITTEEAYKMSAAFGGGMGLGETCGAVVGAMIVLGLKYGHCEVEHMGQKDIMNAKRAEFLQKFQEKYAVCNCKGLLKHDISKPEEVLAKAKELNIDGITTCGMDTGIRAIGRVCDELGLWGISYKTACTLSDKYLSKLAFEKAGVPCAKAFQIRTEEELSEALEKLPLPVVVKAVDLMGSRGIYQCNTREESFAAFSNAMKSTSRDYCLVEEFLEGVIFGAEGLFADGKLVFCFPVGTDLYYQSTIPTCIGHFAPFTIDIQKEAEQIITAALTEAGARNTPFNCDLILKNGKVYLIEINGRAGATGLSDMVGIYYDLNYYEILCRQAMGETTASAFQLKNSKGQPSVSRMLTAPKTGILEKIELPEEAEDPDISITLI